MTYSAIDSYVVRDNLFFVIHEGKLVAWNYRDHEQYVLSMDCLRALLDSTFRRQNVAVAKELISAKLLVPESQARRRWGWDLLRRSFT